MAEVLNSLGEVMEALRTALAVPEVLAVLILWMLLGSRGDRRRRRIREDEEERLRVRSGMRY